jgi:hypothetical protein
MLFLVVWAIPIIALVILSQVIKSARTLIWIGAVSYVLSSAWLLWATIDAQDQGGIAFLFYLPLVIAALGVLISGILKADLPKSRKTFSVVLAVLLLPVTYMLISWIAFTVRWG